MAGLYRYAARARAALAAQPAPEPVPPQDGPDFGAIIHSAIWPTHPRSPPRPIWSKHPTRCSGCTRMVEVSSGDTRRPRSRPILLRRYQTHPEPGPEPVQAQEDRQDGQNVDSGAAGSAAAAVPRNEALDTKHRADQ